MFRNIVEVTCYGKKETMKREEAKKFYLEAMMFSEGSERERYTNIYIGLMNGLDEVSDETI